MTRIDTQSTIMSYVDINPIATLGTINDDGSPHGAIVYVCSDVHRPVMYFLTKNETTKYRNILRDNRVSITITHPSENSTLQSNGTAEIVRDIKTINAAMDRLTKLHVNSVDWLPPIAKLRAGTYALVAVNIERARLAEFDGRSIGDEHIFVTMEK